MRFVKLIIICVLNLLALPSAAKVHSLIVAMTDGTTAELKVSADLQTSFSDHAVIFSYISQQYVYDLAAVAGFSFMADASVSNIEADSHYSFDFEHDGLAVTAPDGAEVTLCDANGRVVVLFKGSGRLSTSSLSPGVYIVSVGAHNIKFVK